MIFKNINIIDENFELKKDRTVIVREGKIAYIGNDRQKVDEFGRLRNEEIYQGKGKLLISGFYNAHGHSPMTLMRGYGENLILQDWLEQKIFPFEAKLTGEDVYWGTMLAMAESFKNGIVSTTDMYYFCEDMIKAIDIAGAKNNISRGVVNFTDRDFWDLDSYTESKDLFEKYHKSLEGRINVDMSIHAEYTSNEKTVRQLAQFAKEIGAGVHIHVSETKREHEDCKKRYGLTPIQYFEKTGLLDNRTTAAHCVWIEEEDLKIIKNKNVTVASNPFSNLKLASGICDVPSLLNENINVAIGTDSVASNNSLNFFEEMKAFATLSKAKFYDARLITSKQAFYAGTRAGAIGQGRLDCGLIKEGYRADLLMLNIENPNFIPVHNMLHNLVYSGSSSDIEMTIIDGKTVYNKGEYVTIDIEKTIRMVEKISDRISKAL